MSVRKKWVPYLFILPAVLLILCFKIIPIFTTLLESFTFNGQISLKTYEHLFTDPSFWKSLWVTIKFALILTPLQIVLAVIVALFVNQSYKGVGVVRTIVYLPCTISITVATFLWSAMLNESNGIVNNVLKGLGFSAQGFFNDVDQAFWCIVVVTSWIGVGYWMMFILSGLKNIDGALYEAAELDGANWFQRCIHVTLPMLRRVLLFVAVANTTSNILLFAPMQLITHGGPQGSTNVLMYEAYQSAFSYADRPRSSAIITILLVIILLICMLEFRLLSDDDAPVKRRKGGRNA